jgi:hypothetical protein
LPREKDFPPRSPSPSRIVTSSNNYPDLQLRARIDGRTELRAAHEYTVPVCRSHHRKLHSYGDEASGWAGVNVDPVPIALALWQRTRPDQAPRSPSDDTRSPGAASTGIADHDAPTS